MTLKSQLEQAIQTGEILYIRYQGGSKPGTIRQISPMDFVSESQIRARCIASSQAKVFSLDKIEICGPASTLQEDYATAPDRAEPKSLSEAMGEKLEALKSAGWHVETSTDSVSLHEFFKNGKPRKTPVLTISFYEYTYDSEWDDDACDLVEIRRKSTRPWGVGCQRLGLASTFKYPSKAVEKFLWAERTLRSQK